MEEKRPHEMEVDKEKEKKNEEKSIEKKGWVVDVIKQLIYSAKY